MISEGKTILIGINVTHPSSSSASDAPSVVGVVASVDRLLGKWPADLRIQTARQERVSGLDGMLKSRLRLWARTNKRSYPETILVYGDRVSEGQYDIVLEKELPLLRKACKETYPAIDTQNGLPHIFIVMVGKHHHTRFYPTRKEDACRSLNPQNSTVVDRGVTKLTTGTFYFKPILRSKVQPDQLITTSSSTKYSDIRIRRHPSRMPPTASKI